MLQEKMACSISRHEMIEKLILESYAGKTFGKI